VTRQDGRDWEVVDKGRGLWMSPQTGRRGVWDVTIEGGERLGSVYTEKSGSFRALPHEQAKPLPRVYRTKEEAARALLSA
jgi:hypothetical protein